MNRKYLKVALMCTAFYLFIFSIPAQAQSTDTGDSTSQFCYIRRAPAGQFGLDLGPRETTCHPTTDSCQIARDADLAPDSENWVVVSQCQSTAPVPGFCYEVLFQGEEIPVCAPEIELCNQYRANAVRGGANVRTQCNSETFTLFQADSKQCAVLGKDGRDMQACFDDQPACLAVTARCASNALCSIKSRCSTSTPRIKLFDDAPEIRAPYKPIWLDLIRQYIGVDPSTIQYGGVASKDGDNSFYQNILITYIRPYQVIAANNVGQATAGAVVVSTQDVPDQNDTEPATNPGQSDQGPGSVNGGGAAPADRTNCLENPTSINCVQDPLSTECYTDFNGARVCERNTIFSLLFKAIRGLTNILIPLSVLMIIYGGLQFVIARGNESKITDAKKTFTNIIIGVTLIIGARIFVEIINAIRLTL